MQALKATHRGDGNMKLSSFLADTTDPGSVMAAKVAPAAGLVGTSQMEVAREHLVPILNMPWADFAAMLAAAWTGLLIAEWCWKKAVAFCAWRRAREQHNP